MGELAIRNMAVLARRIDAVIPRLSGLRFVPGDDALDRRRRLLDRDLEIDLNGRR